MKLVVTEFFFNPFTLIKLTGLTAWDGSVDFLQSFFEMVFSGKLEGFVEKGLARSRNKSFKKRNLAYPSYLGSHLEVEKVKKQALQVSTCIL